MKRYVLCGNPNCGKTTLFNVLTGRELHTGNYAGVTVCVSESPLSVSRDVTLCDLPGVYSLDPVSEDERAAADFLRNEPYDGIVSLLDGTCMGRGLYLTLTLCEKRHPMMVAVNMADECAEQGIGIDTAALSKRLGVPVFLLSASKGQGIAELLTAIEAGDFSVPYVVDSPDTESRYRMVDDIVRQCVTAEERKPQLCSADRVLLASPFAVPIFALGAGILFMAIFDILSPALSGWLNGLFSLLTEWVRGMFPPSSRRGAFVCDGILGGVSSVLGFLPAVVLVFLALSILEDSGYASRISVIFEGIMGKIGLGGRSVIPLILGFGCTVPAVTALKTIKNRRERYLSALLIPFMPCSAKIPVMTLFAQAFFSSYRGLVMAAVYGISVIAGVLTVWVLSRLCGVRGAGECVTELPTYRMPAPASVGKLIAKKCRGFVWKAVTVILLSSSLIWVLSHIGTDFHYVSGGEESLLYAFGEWICPVFAPLGFGFPAAAVAVLCGFSAKEAVVSSLAMQLGAGVGGLSAILPVRFGFPAAMAYLAFVMLYPPCISAEAAYCEEMGIGGMLASVMLQFAAAYGVGMAVFMILR